MHWIYLSPHLDDAILSCGGLIWDQVQAGNPVSIWTICAGDPPEGPLSAYAEELHARWGVGRDAVSRRREEDLAASRLVGADPSHFAVPDCIYRLDSRGQPMYTSDHDLFRSLHPADEDWVEALTAELCCNLPDADDYQLVCPLTVGSHVDHQLTRRAAEKLDLPLLYYADYPYISYGFDLPLCPGGSAPVETTYPLSASGMRLWEEAVAAYASQISSFWPGLEEMRLALRAYSAQIGGSRLYDCASHT